MKQPKRLTKDQKIIASAHELIPSQWMLLEEMEFYLKLIKKDTKQIKFIDKFRKAKK